MPIPVAVSAFIAAVELLTTGLDSLETRFAPTLGQLAKDARAAGEIGHLVGEEVRILRRCVIHATRRFSASLQESGSEDGQEWLATVFDSHEKVARAVRDAWETLRTSGCPEAALEGAWTRFQQTLATIHPTKATT